jgi:hypothetical protein
MKNKQQVQFLIVWFVFVYLFDVGFVVKRFVCWMGEWE